jgi:hypothetical protein
LHTASRWIALIQLNGASLRLQAPSPRATRLLPPPLTSINALRWTVLHPGDLALGARSLIPNRRQEVEMKAMLLLTASGALLILTSYASIEDPQLLEKLKVKGIAKFAAFDVPLGLAKERYAGHFQIVSHDLRETDDLRVLDFDGQRIFRLFRFAELGPAALHEGGMST